jgi:hypothetical protein
VLLLPWLLQEMAVLSPDVIVYDFFAIWGRFLETLLPGTRHVCSMSWSMVPDPQVRYTLNIIAFTL